MFKSTTSQSLHPKHPKSHSAQAGDLTYYAPWGNLAIFTGNFGSASGLVYFGRIDKGLDEFTALPDNAIVTIKVCDEMNSGINHFY
ncbi:MULTISPECIES: cyclophilin-like fold protein [Moraxella]|jgi:hypothetical protein|uniref:Cyclophilin-like domain-containing protein n=1 Tax=Moraxella lacunata TaxID=477 RepID=A0A1B8PVI8_MORLA|nr:MULTISPECIES: cyclophilin-like fold protein [Moraxella]MBE9579402.1 hypothetical protein [Moraxella sp. K1664]MBE9588749.1 hypothetical protein [Moraxella sp. K1630]MBE9591251.1 hypothetical protein [Moraxella sp. K127]MBE9596960.1 hypothetical protein [Moraxella sp. K2450]MDH9219536.1 cyclophilin-like fold protein [Moraxella lacunata]